MAITKATASSIAPAAKGDLVAGSATNDAAVLGVGANDTVLTADSTAATGLKWATPSSGGMTLISTTTLTGSSVTLSSIPGTYKNLQLIVRNYLPSADGAVFHIRANGDTTSNQHNEINGFENGQFGYNNNAWVIDPGANGQDSAASESLLVLDIYDYANTTTMTMTGATYVGNHNTTNYNFWFGGFLYKPTTAITSLELFVASGTFTSGTALLYGVK
jgi:hypothetical protein